MTNFFEKIDAMITNIYSSGESLTTDTLRGVITEAKTSAADGVDLACAVKGKLEQSCKDVTPSTNDNITPETMYAVGMMIDLISRDAAIDNYINGETCAVINFAGAVLCDNQEL